MTPRVNLNSVSNVIPPLQKDSLTRQVRDQPTITRRVSIPNDDDDDLEREFEATPQFQVIKMANVKSAPIEGQR